jgi:hypothetical protein
MNVITAIRIAKGEHMTPEQESTRPQVAADKPNPTKKARAAKGKGKPQRKAKEAAQGRRKPAEARQGSKTEQVLDLLKRSGGASLADIMTLTGWQPHSVRGFISGTLGKKMGLTVESSKREDGERIYRLPK